MVKLGEFSRGGKNRVAVQAADHDAGPVGTVTPVGLFLPKLDELFLFCVTSKVTSDCLADCLESWWVAVKERFSHVKVLVLNLDNGPENNSHRTQFMARLVQLAKKWGLTIRLAYYPPYHSKYNPVERCWGILEQHWNGDLLDSLETVVKFARSMRWEGKQPVVEVINRVYRSGVKLSKAAMTELETQLVRLPKLERWFVEIDGTRLARDT